jgi:outer membrane lipase/esterase
MRAHAYAFVLLLFSVPAAADPANYKRVISFGDSLSDNGNLAAFHAAPPPPYYFGRFSNGPTWVEILAGPGGQNGLSSQQQFWVDLVTLTPLDGGSVNVALGGARADSGPNSNGPIPGVPLQIATYEAYSTASGQTAFKPTDLVTLLAGANDIFQGYSTAALGGLSGLQILGTNTATSVTADVNQLIAGGAKTILLANLPNIGVTPLFQGIGQSVGGQAVTLAFNQALNLQTQVVAALNPSVNIVQMDLYALNNVIRANPLAFGFTNITQQCFLNPNCNQTTAAGFAFWDDVHPTEAVHQLFARYAALLLSTEETGKAVSALSQIALSTRLESSDILFRRGVSPLGPVPTGFYAEIIGSTTSFNGAKFATYGNTAYDFSLGGARVGFDGASGPISFGSSFAYQSGAISGDALEPRTETAPGLFCLPLRAMRMIRVKNIFNSSPVKAGVFFCLVL